MSFVSVTNENYVSLDVLRDAVYVNDDVHTVVDKVRMYQASHPLNKDSMKLADVSVTQDIGEIRHRVVEYIEARRTIVGDDLATGFEDNVPNALEEDYETLESLERSLNDGSTQNYIRQKAAKYLALIKPTSEFHWLRNAVYYNDDNAIGYLKTYIKQRYIALDCHYRMKYALADSFEYNECLGGSTMIVVHPINMTDVKVLQRTVHRADSSEKKVALMYEFIANHMIEQPIETLACAHPWNSIDSQNELVDQYEREFRTCRPGLYEKTAETIEHLNELEHVLDSGVTDQDLQRAAAYYLATKYTDKSTFWLRMALLARPSKCSQFVQKFIEERRKDFNEERNERRIAMENVAAESIQQEKDAMEIIDRHNEAVANGEQCPHCGAIFTDVTDICEMSDGTMVCQDCYENIRQCNDCGEYHDKDDMTFINGEWYCDDCVSEHWVQCHDCGTWMRRESYDAQYSDIEDEWYCESCYDERFTHCSDCECEIYRDDAYYTDYDDGPYCSDCYYDNHYDDSDVIYDYHEYDGGWDTMYAPSEDQHDYKLTFGFEIEVGGRKRYADGLQDIMQDTAILAKDSTVDGFEIITMPMTRQYFEECFRSRMQKGFQYLIDHDFKGHGEGGIHIHFSTIKNRAQLLRMIKILYTQDTVIQKLWGEITQRGSNMNWCSITDRYWSDEDILSGKSMVASRSDDNHHTALNYDPDTETHELRIFNSTTRMDRFLKNAQVLFSLLDYTSMGGKNLRVDVYSWLDFVKAHSIDYPELDKFLVEKDLYNYGLTVSDDIYDVDTCPVLDASYCPKQLSFDFESLDDLEVPNKFRLLDDLEDDLEIDWDSFSDNVPDITQDEVDAFAQVIEDSLAN